MTGLFALFCEMALAAWVFFWLGVAWWMGVLMALGVTLTLHGIFLHVFDNRERPKESIHRIKTFASVPAIYGFLIALALAVLARYVHGSVAVVLLPAFSFALWLGTMSLLILAASLFTIAHIQSWSARHAKQYQELDHEERVSSAFLDELRADGKTVGVPVREPPRPLEVVASSSVQSPANKAGAGFVAMAIVSVALITGATGCSTATTAAGAPEAEIAVATAQTDHLHVFVDTSGSCVRPALQEAWNTVRRELPELVERHAITKLTIWQFDEDGWSPRRIKEIVLPVQRIPIHHQAASTEWASFANIRAAVLDDEEREWRRRTMATEAQYRESIQRTLGVLEAEHVLPEANHETAQTDIVGLLRRIAQTAEREPQDVIIITDLADTQYRTTPRLPSPRKPVRVLVLAVPAQPKDARMTLGKALPGPEQFEVRSGQLHDSALDRRGTVLRAESNGTTCRSTDAVAEVVLS